MSELAPLLRILSYIVGTWLVAKGVPEPLANYITNDPAVIDLVAQAVGGFITVAAFIWWRIAKRFGGAT